MNSTQDALERADALDRAGRSEAACDLLREEISKAASPGESVALARHLAHKLIRDGRERAYLKEFQRHREAWARDGYLVFTRGLALHHFDHLHAAEAAYREVLRLSRSSDAWYAAARDNLDRLAEEFARIEKAGAALSRARIGIGLGLLALGLGLLLARRSLLAKEPDGP